MQPTLTQVPPRAASSAMATRTPRWPAMRAARTPPLPAPMMKRSKTSWVMRTGRVEKPGALTRTIPVARRGAGDQTRAIRTMEERADVARQVDSHGSRRALRGALDRRPCPALDLHRHALGGHCRAAGEDLRARRRPARLAAVVSLEPPRPADARRIQRSTERCGRNLALEEQELGRRRDDFHGGRAEPASRLRALPARLRNHLFRRASLRSEGGGDEGHLDDERRQGQEPLLSLEGARRRRH